MRCNTKCMFGGVWGVFVTQGGSVVLCSFIPTFDSVVDVGKQSYLVMVSGRRGHGEETKVSRASPDDRSLLLLCFRETSLRLSCLPAKVAPGCLSHDPFAFMVPSYHHHATFSPLSPNVPTASSPVTKNTAPLQIQNPRRLPVACSSPPQTTPLSRFDQSNKATNPLPPLPICSHV